MITSLDENTPLITVGTGDNQIAISLRELPSDQSQALSFSTITISLNGIEIEIRRKSKSTAGRSRSVTHRVNDQERKPKTEHLHWDYSTFYGPNMWGRIFPQIQNKKYQSPIRIYSEHCEYKPSLARHSFIFDCDENCCQILENTGHSFQVSGKGYSYITGGPTVDEYQFLQFHMHWGSHDTEGSEHVIDGIRYPAELHIVTWNTTKYKSPQEAVASEEFGGLMVFGILVQIISSDNPDMVKLLDLFSKITHKGEKINLDNDVISLKSLMPQNMLNYYTYDGSLTTPMCSECVRWIVFQDRMGLSRNQINQLRQLKHISKTEHTINGRIDRNYRPLMPINGRVVYRSFP